MGLKGARGFGRISENLDCSLQAAMVAEDIKEPDFYQSVMMEPYPREYGERRSARRRGLKFEELLHENHAAKLRRALGPLIGIAPDRMTVRNMVDEVPYAPQIKRSVSTSKAKAMTAEEKRQLKVQRQEDRKAASRLLRELRYMRTRKIVKDMASGKEPVHLIIEPQLRIWVGPGKSDYVYITPDFMTFWPALGTYVVGEVKSFIIRENVVDATDLNQVRRQAAAQILALQALAHSVDQVAQVPDKAVFIFALPWALTAAPPQVEPLEGAVVQVKKAIHVLRRVAAAIPQVKTYSEEPLANLIVEFETNFKDSCVGKCVMADYCQRLHQGTARVLGDVAAEHLGADMPIERVVALLDGASPESDRERELLPLLLEADQLLREAS